MRSMSDKLQCTFQGECSCEEIVYLLQYSWILIRLTFKICSHNEYVQYDASHDKVCEISRVIYEIEAPPSDLIFGYLNDLSLFFYNHSHHINPSDFFSIKMHSVLFIPLSFLKVHEQYTCEKVEEEEASNKYEEDEKERIHYTRPWFGTGLYSCSITICIHYIWPSLIIRHNEKSEHCRNDIIHVPIECLPLTSGLKAFFLIVSFIRHHRALL